MDLQRAVARWHRRSWFAVAAVSAIGLNLVGAAAIWCGLRAPRVVEVHEAPPPPEVIAVPTTIPLVLPELTRPAPTALPAERRTRGACPPPRRGAPMPDQLELPHHDIGHIAPAPTNASWVAGWGGSGLYVSYDAGATFRTVLGAEGESEEDAYASARIYDVTFDCHGRLFVLAGNKLGVYERENAKLTWLYDYRDEFAGLDRWLFGGGPDLVILHANEDAGTIELAVSRDLAASWTTHVVRTGVDGELGAWGQQSADGTIRVKVRGDVDRLDVLLRRDSLLVTTSPPPPYDASASYGNVDVAVAGERVLWRISGNAWQPVDGLPARGVGEIGLVPGPSPSVVIGGALYTITRGKARKRFAWPAADGRTTTEPAVIDVAGRVWAIKLRDGGDCDGTATPVLVGRVR